MDRGNESLTKDDGLYEDGHSRQISVKERFNKVS